MLLLSFRETVGCCKCTFDLLGHGAQDLCSCIAMVPSEFIPSVGCKNKGMWFSLCLTAEENFEANSHKLHENLQLHSLNLAGQSLWLLLCPCCRTAGWACLCPWLQLGCSWQSWVSSWWLAQLAHGQHPQSYPVLLLLKGESSTTQAESSGGSSVQLAGVKLGGCSGRRELNLPGLCLSPKLHS